MQIRNYEAKDGTKRIAAEVVADEVRFLSPKGEGAAPAAVPENDAVPEDDMVGDDDLPF